MAKTKSRISSKKAEEEAKRAEEEAREKKNKYQSLLESAQEASEWQKQHHEYLSKKNGRKVYKPEEVDEELKKI